MSIVINVDEHITLLISIMLI